jgi:hypothetical protein
MSCYCYGDVLLAIIPNFHKDQCTYKPKIFRNNVSVVSGYTNIRVEHICSDNTLAQLLVNLFNQQVRKYTHENVS